MEMMNENDAITPKVDQTLIGDIESLNRFMAYPVDKSIVLVEEYNKEKLKILIDNFDELSDKIGKMRDLKNGYKKIDDKGANKTILQNLYKAKQVEYKGSRSSIDGRLFGPNSLQGINRSCRHTVCFNNDGSPIYYDYDIVGCHNNLLGILCGWLGIDWRFLKEYNDNRNERINELMNHFKVNRDDAKTIVLSMLNGGGDFYIREDDTPNWLHSLKLQLRVINEKLCELNPELYKSAKRQKDYNPEGTVLNKILCKMENIVLQCMKKWCNKNDIKVGTLCFDGMLLKEKIEIEKLENFIKSELGIEIKIVEKEMNEGIDLGMYEGFKKEALKDYDYSKVDFYIEKLDNEIDYDDIYSYQQFIGDNKFIDIEMIEKLLYNTVIECLSGGRNSSIITKKKEWNERLKKHRYVYTTDVKLDSLLKIMLKRVVVVKNCKKALECVHPIARKACAERPFFEVIISDVLENMLIKGKIRTVDSIVFEPYFLEQPKYLDNKLNLFTGFELLKNNKWFDTKTNYFENSPVYNHITKYLCGNNPEIYNYELDKIAHMIQKPTDKIDQFSLYTSEQGNFKDGCYQLQRKLLGEDLVISFESVDDFFSNFNVEQSCKLLIMINEISESGMGVSDGMKRHNKLKGLITGKTLRVEKKGVDAIRVNDYSRYMLFSNFEGMYVENTDRRGVYIKSDSTHANDSVYFKPLWDSLDDLDFIKSAFSFFAHRDISLFNAHKGPHSEFKNEMKVKCLNSVLSFIKDFWQYKDLDDEFRIHTGDLYVLYKNYCSEYGIGKSLKRLTFKDILSKFGLKELSSQFMYKKSELETDALITEKNDNYECFCSNCILDNADNCLKLNHQSNKRVIPSKLKTACFNGSIISNTKQNGYLLNKENITHLLESYLKIENIEI
jgi:hypothetical protein